jgi:predicted component of type VI protein secretion system
LKTGGSTLENKIEEAMIDFENRLKRSVNLVESSQDRLNTVLMAKIPGLRSCPEKKFYEDHVRVSR